MPNIYGIIAFVQIEHDKEPEMVCTTHKVNETCRKCRGNSSDAGVVKSRAELKADFQERKAEHQADKKKHEPPRQRGRKFFSRAPRERD